MGLETNFNQDPYWDDYDETKGFHRVLFKPGVAVQAREMNQLQSILQKQVERFGDNILIEGTIVKDCQFTFLRPFPYVKILDLQTDGQPVVMSAYKDQYAVGQSTGVTAQILLVSNGLQAQSPNLNTLHVKYLKSNGANKTFSATENIEIRSGSVTGTIITTVTAAGSVESNSIGNGIGFKIGSGVIYQKGNFVLVDEQSVIVSKYDTSPSERLAVGFLTTETIVNSFNDTTLLDNAAGYFNENAPGADRLKLTPTLTVKTVSAANDDKDFFTLVEYQNGFPVKRKEKTEYAVLGNEMARRTSEESGNYTVRAPFISVSSANGTHLSADFGSTLAYVDGKRIETYGKISRYFSNGSTDFEEELGENLTPNIGHYVVVDELIGKIPTDNLVTLRLYDTAQNAATGGSPTSTGNNIGTCKARAVEYHSGSQGSAACQYKLYLFDIRISTASKNFRNDVKSIVYFSGSALGCADIVLSAASKAIIVDNSFKKSFFPIGRDAIKEILTGAGKNTTFTYSTHQDVTLTSNAATITLTDETFTLSGTDLSDTVKRENIIVVSQSNDIISLDDATVSVTGGGSTMELTDVDSADGTVTVYYTAEPTEPTPIIKNSRTAYVIVSAASSGTSGTYSLGLPDVYDIVSVRKHTTTFSTATDGSDVTSRFRLVPNQRDAYYGLSYVKKARALTIGSGDYLLFTVKVFERSSGIAGGRGFACVDSYITGASPVTEEQIPVYRSENGIEYDLRDVMDFRPYAANTVAIATTFGSAPTCTTAVNAAITFSNNTQYNVSPNVNAVLDYRYYLPRRDKVVLDSSGNFEIIGGTADLRPLPPPNSNRGMVIASIYVPAYPALPSKTANAAGKPQYGVKITPIENKGYTMQDIAQIDRRVEQLEYYTVLNQLEMESKDKDIVDEDGNNRFKNGIFTDSFTDLFAADVKNTEFAASVEPTVGELQPEIRQFDIDLDIKTGGLTNMVNYGPRAMLQSTDVIFKENPYATKGRNCVSQFWNFKGTVGIFPEYDAGYDVTRAPAFDIDIDLAKPFMDFTNNINKALSLLQPKTEVTGSSSSTSRRRVAGGTQVTTTTVKTIKETSAQIKVTNGSTTKEKVGDFITDVRFNPFMRSIPIRFVVTGLRPTTQIHVFFDGQNVDAHCAPAIQTGSPNGTNVRVFKRSGAFGATLTTDTRGVLRGVFLIPEGTFHVGDRNLVFADTSSFAEVNNAITSASIVYHAFNYSVEKTALNLDIQSPKTEINATTRNRTETSTAVTGFIPDPPPQPEQQSDGDASTANDPIAQTFLIKKQHAPGSDQMFLSKVDVFFTQKSSDLGVTMYIRKTNNGFPAQEVLPFGKVHLTTEEVSVSADASVATTFTFPAPVALAVDEEYSFVLLPDGDNPDYRIWCAKTGDTDVLKNIPIVRDMDDGTLFTSTNNRAWTAVQDENIKFNLYNKKFNQSSGSAIFVNKNSEYLTINSASAAFKLGEYAYIEEANSAGTVNMVAGNTTLIGTTTTFTSTVESGDYVVVYANSTVVDVLEVATVTNNTVIVLADVPKTSNATANWYKTIAGQVTHYDTSFEDVWLHLDHSNARGANTDNKFIVAGDTITGEISGATATVQSVDNRKVSYLAPNINRTNPVGTSVTGNINRLYDEGNSTNYSITREIEFNNYRYLIEKESVIKSRSNEIYDGDGDTRSFEFKVNLNTLGGRQFISPSIAVDSARLQVYEYNINNDSTDEYTQDGAANSKYISKVISLADGLDAEDLKVFLTGYRPTGTTLEVYAKFLNKEDPDDINTRSWTKLTAKASNPISQVNNRDDFKEFEFNIPTTVGASDSGTFDGSTFQYTDGTAVYNDFKYFQIKIVMLASGHHRVPRVADIRAIALAA